MTNSRRALLLDAAGTLLLPAEPIAETYARVARRHGLDLDIAEIAPRIGPSMREARPLRMLAPDWRPFWATVVARCTGSDDSQLLDALLDHFRSPGAWLVAPGAEACCARLRGAGFATALVSNWDVHLRPLCTELGVAACFDALVISAEEGLEKPDPRLFERACQKIGVEPRAAVHVGDSEHDDVAGARAAGCTGWLLGRDIVDFEQLALRLLAD